MLSPTQPEPQFRSTIGQNTRHVEADPKIPICPRLRFGLVIEPMFVASNPVPVPHLPGAASVRFHVGPDVIQVRTKHTTNGYGSCT